MPGVESGIEILHDQAGWRVGLWKNILFTGISTSPTVSSLQLAREGQRRLPHAHRRVEFRCNA